MSAILPSCRAVLRAWPLVLCAVALGACREREEDDEFTEADRAAIIAVRTSVQEAANAGDVAKWAAAYADDAETMAPNLEPVAGKAAITETLKGFPPLSNVKFTHRSIEGAGDWAWVDGTYEMTITPPGAPAMQDRGKYVEIWKRQADGSWRLYRDIYNSSIPLPATPQP